MWKIFKKEETRFAYYLLLPTLIILIFVIAYPIIDTFYLSLHKYYLTRPHFRPFIGIKNYLHFLSSEEFWNSIKRTGYFMGVSVTLELILGILTALLLMQKAKGMNFLKTIIILPWAVPTIVNGAIWKWIYNADYGALNGILYKLGIISTYKTWLADPFTALNFVIVADIWHSTPFVIIVMLAALTTIPESLYEAAKIDGAGAIKRFFNITLPLLAPAILVALVIRTVEAFRVFDIIYVITRGGPANGTQVIAYQAYLETFSYLHLGKGSALSFIISIFIMILAVIYIKVLYNRVEY